MQLGRYDLRMAKAKQKYWQEQCAATERLRERFGLTTALSYIVYDKLLNFLEFIASHPDDLADLPAFVAEIRRRFTPAELRDYLDVVRRKRGRTHRRSAVLREARGLLLDGDR